MVWRFSVFFSQKYHFHVSGLGECAKYLTLFDISAFVALLDVAYLLIYNPHEKGLFHENSIKGKKLSYCIDGSDY